MPTTRPSPHSSLRSLVAVEAMMSRLPFNTSRIPRTDARVQKAWRGWAKARMAPIRNRTPSAVWAHFHARRTTATMNSFSPATMNTIPSNTPTVVIDVTSNRSTMSAMISQAIPVMRKSHQTPVMAPNIEVS